MRAAGTEASRSSVAADRVVTESLDRSGRGVGVGDGLLRFEARAMASPLRLTVPASIPAGTALAAWTEVRVEFEAAEQAMSRFRETSDLSAANRAARRGPMLAVDPRLRRALVTADRAHRVTDGRFDARVIGDLERLGYRGAWIGADDGSAGARVPGRLLAVERPARIRLSAPADLGGIGKGLALRWAARRVERLLPAGVGALIEAGGDLVVTGQRPRPGPTGGDEPEFAVAGGDRGSHGTG